MTEKSLLGFVATVVVTAVGFLLVAYLFWLFFPSEMPDDMYWFGAIGGLVLLEIIQASQYLRKKQT
jgi:ABC-type antimicrobial peptide transport system permease subunit